MTTLADTNDGKIKSQLIPETRHVPYTPWGKPIAITEMNGGAFIVNTDSHAGIFIPPELMEQMPLSARKTEYSDNGWFEEDRDILIPIAILGVRICKTPEEVAEARKIVLEDRYYERPYLSTFVPASLMDEWEAGTP